MEWYVCLNAPQLQYIINKKNYTYANTNKNNTLAEKLERNIYIGYLENHLTKKDLVQILILIFDLLNIMTISKYAKKVGKTYRGVKNFSKDLIQVDDFTFVSDNK